MAENCKIGSSKDSELIPTEKLRKNLERINSEEKNNPLLQKICLICTGSYNPIHKMHLKIFEIAREAFEKQGATVVCGWISPSHDDYVKSKLGNQYISATHRNQMVSIAVENSDFLELSKWETHQPYFVDFPGVVRHHASFLENEFPNEKIKLFYLCGADHAYKCRLTNGIGKSGVCCVDRNNLASKLYSKSHLFKLFPAPKSLNSDLSSTEVRRKLEKGESVLEDCGAGVEEYIKANSILLKHKV